MNMCKDYLKSNSDGLCLAYEYFLVLMCAINMESDEFIEFLNFRPILGSKQNKGPFCGHFLR